MERLQYQFLHQVGEWLACHVYQNLLNDCVAAAGVSKLCPGYKVNGHRRRVCGLRAVKHLEQGRQLFSRSITLKTVDGCARCVAEQFTERDLLLFRKGVGG